MPACDGVIEVFAEGTAGPFAIEVVQYGQVVKLKTPIPSALKKNLNVLEYVDDMKVPSLGTAVATTNIVIDNSRGRFYARMGTALPRDMQIHHAIPRETITRRYPGLLTVAQMHSLENLRGIPNHLKGIGVNGNVVSLHQEITNKWTAWFNARPTATVEQLLHHARQIDIEYGSRFIPPIR